MPSGVLRPYAFLMGSCDLPLKPSTTPDDIFAFAWFWPPLLEDYRQTHEPPSSRSSTSRHGLPTPGDSTARRRRVACGKFRHMPIGNVLWFDLFRQAIPDLLDEVEPISHAQAIDAQRIEAKGLWIFSWIFSFDGRETCVGSLPPGHGAEKLRAAQRWQPSLLSNVGDQRLAALGDPHQPFLSRVRWIALFCPLRCPPSMEQLARCDWAYIIRVDSDEGHSVTAIIYKLDFVCPAAFVDMHDRSDITTSEPFVGWFAIEHDERMFGNHESSSGYAVTSRGGRSPSTIHTANTLPSSASCGGGRSRADRLGLGRHREEPHRPGLHLVVGPLDVQHVPAEISSGTWMACPKRAC